MRHPQELLVEQWHQACAAVDCRYPVASGRDRSHDEFTGCPGYRGTLHLESRQYVMRYTLCARHLAWWSYEQARIRARKDRDQGKRGAGYRNLA